MGILDRMARTAKAAKAVRPSKEALLAAEAAAREAARLQTIVSPVRASQALSPYEGAYLKTIPYDRMKVDLSAGERGGPGFSGIQLVDPLYENAAAGVTDKKTSTRIINRNKNVPEGAPVIWTPSVGKVDQLKSNATMFNKFADEFDKVKGSISPELLQKMSEYASKKVDNNKKPIFPQGMDFTDANYRRIPTTYPQRGFIAEILSGEGVGGKKGKTVANYEQLIQDNLDPLVASVPTGSLGPRLFTLDNGVMIRPDLHRDYPFVLTGKDEGVTYYPVPREHVMTTFADVVQQLKGRPVTDMDYGRGDPTQYIDRELIRRLDDIGYAEGGEVRMSGGGRTGILGALARTAERGVERAALKVKPPSDNIAVVKSANFEYPKIIGNQTLKINDVSGGVRMSDPYERKRVEALAQKMSSPNGYISRIIVDHKNNVIEGQHRLEALRHLGIEDVPVYKIEDLSDTMPVASMESALNAVAPIHPDHVNQLISHALEDIAENGIDHARTLDYGKYQKFYDAALDAAMPIKKANGGRVNSGITIGDFLDRLNQSIR
jgi:hypothetical protein